MPGLRGTELAALIKAIRPHTLIMIVTAGLDIEQTRERTRELNVGEVFLKPLDRNRMAEAIEAILLQNGKDNA